MEYLETLNQALFLKLNASPDTPAWLICVATTVANDLIFIIPLLLLTMWLWGDNAQRNRAIKSSVVAFAGLVLSQLAGLVWQHPRPFAMGLGHAFLQHAPDSSFPSDHMTVFCSVGISLLFGRTLPWGAIILLCGLAVAWSRIALGVHFPLDMAGAVLVSGAAYALVTPVWAKAGDRITKILVSLYRVFLAWPIGHGWIQR